MNTAKYREELTEAALLIRDLAAEAEADYAECGKAVDSALLLNRKDARVASADFVRARKRWAGLMAAQGEIGYLLSEVDG